MNDDSYYMPILCIGIAIRISISKIFSSVLGGIESIGKMALVHIDPPLKFILHVKPQITSKFGKKYQIYM